MPIAGQRSSPTEGVKGSKPKLLNRKRLPKLPRTPQAEDLQELSSIYLRERNAQMRAKRLSAELVLARERDQLIEKTLAERQLTYLLISMRQKLLGLPLKIGNHFGNREVPIREVVEYGKRVVNEIFSELPGCQSASSPSGWKS